MTVRPIHLLGSPVLRERSEPVDVVTDDTRDLIDDLFETMYAAKGIGLAANQVGVATRIAVVDTGGETRLALINPRVVESQGEERQEEGCLSIPDLYGEVARPAVAEVEALDRKGNLFRVRAEGLLARAIQHEIDHLDGVLFVDRLSLVKRRLLLAKWRKQRKGKKGHLLHVESETADT